MNFTLFKFLWAVILLSRYWRFDDFFFPVMYDLTLVDQVSQVSPVSPKIFSPYRRYCDFYSRNS